MRQTGEMYMQAMSAYRDSVDRWAIPVGPRTGWWIGVAKDRTVTLSRQVPYPPEDDDRGWIPVVSYPEEQGDLRLPTDWQAAGIVTVEEPTVKPRKTVLEMVDRCPAGYVAGRAPDGGALIASRWHGDDGAWLTIGDLGPLEVHEPVLAVEALRRVVASLDRKQAHGRAALTAGPILVRTRGLEHEVTVTEVENVAVPRWATRPVRRLREVAGGEMRRYWERASTWC